NVVTSFSIVRKLTEHFYTSDICFVCFFSKSDDFNFITDFDLTTVNTACCNSTTASDCEYVLNRHHEWLVRVTLRSRDEVIYRLHKIKNSLFHVCITFKSFKCRTSNNWNVITREVIFRKKFTNFHFYQFKQLFVVHLVNFVKEYN